METDSIQEVIDSTLNKTFEGDTALMQAKEIIDTIKEESFPTWLNEITHQYLIPFGIKILISIAILIIGHWVIKLLKKIIKGALERHKVEISLALFLNNLCSILLNFILIIAISSVLGVDTSSLVALLASAGLAIGMAHDRQYCK